MNNTRRKALDEVHSRLMEAVDELERIEDEEQDAYYNLPESLQTSERGELMQEYWNTIADARLQLDEIVGELWDIIEPLHQKK